MPQVNIEMDGPVAIVRFTNPPDGFMDGKTVPEITAMLDQLEEDEGVRAIILTGGLPDVFIRHYICCRIRGSGSRTTGRRGVM